MNEIQDRLNRGANVAMARRYGVTAQGLENAKNKMQRTQAEADFAAANYQQALQRGADTATLNDLWNKKAAAETTAAKAKSKYDEARKYADTHRVSPTFEENVLDKLIYLEEQVQLNQLTVDQICMFKIKMAT